MIYQGSWLNVTDNSGVKWVQCIKILGKKPKTPGFVGNLLIVSVKSSKSWSKLKKKTVCRGILVRQKKRIIRKDGSFICFNQNSVVLLNNKGVPVASRIFGPIAKELRRKKNTKLTILCSKII